MNQPAPVFVIINNAAARARLAWPGISDALVRHGVRFCAHETRGGPNDAQERVRAALREGHTTIAAVGGDGTLSHVASGFFERCDESSAGQPPEAINCGAVLALLPAGTGDDFARGLAGGRRATLDDWLQKLVRHYRRSVSASAAPENAVGGGASREESVESTTRRVDVLYGSVKGGAHRFVSLNAMTLGIGAEVAARVAAQGDGLRRLPGEARFAWAALGALAAWRERHVAISVDGGAWRECRTNLIAITNGAFAGGGMNFAPDARIDDGRLDVVTACGITRTGIMRELARIHRGGHLANPRVRIERGTCVRVRIVGKREGGDALGLEADGDVRGETPAEVRVMPGALRVVV
jgi:diacylglycerol kinase (ATP)